MKSLLKNIDLSAVDIHTNKVEINNLYIAAVVYAASVGMPVQYYNLIERKWLATATPCWDWNNTKYRITPPKKNTRPWSKCGDVPQGKVWIRANGSIQVWRVTFIDDNGLVAGGMYYFWNDLASYQHSTDYVKWYPCTVDGEQIVGLDQLKAACKKNNIKCSVRNRGGKIYATLSFDGSEMKGYSINAFVRNIIENATITSCGIYDATFRLNP